MISANKKILALSITLALSSNTYASPSDITQDKARQDCPADLSVLSRAEIDALPAQCVRAEKKSWIDEQAEWLAGLVAAVGLGAGFSGLGSHDGHHAGGASGDSNTGNGGDSSTGNGGDSSTGNGGDSSTGNGGDSSTGNGGDGNGDKPVIHDMDVEVPGSLSDGQVGNYIDAGGDRLDVTIEGDSTIRGAATGTVVDNVVDSTIESQGNLDVAEQGSTGLVVNGSNNTVKQQGDNTVSQGATGNKVTGTGNTLHQEGSASVSGEGSTGSLMEGDGSVVVIDGELRAENAATGAKISGQNGSATVNGPVHVDNASGVVIQGDNGTATVNGDTDVRNGGTGIAIDGKKGTATNTGTLTVDGAGSTGVHITGDGANAAQNGVMKVTNAATGFDISGNGATVKNTSEVSVEDAGSMGVRMTGSDGVFSNTGDWTVHNLGQAADIQGQNNTVTLDGNINVDLRTSKADPAVLDAAKGVSVGGEGNTVNITGNLSLTNSPMTQAITGINHMAEKGWVMTGLEVSGSNNHVVLDGALNGTFTDPDAMLHDGSFDWNKKRSFGMNISGDGNLVEIRGGINLYKAGAEVKRNDNIGVYGLNLSGSNTIVVSGQSVIESHPANNEAANNGVRLINSASDSDNLVIFDKNSTLTIKQYRGQSSGDWFSSVHVIFLGSLINEGYVDLSGSEVAQYFYYGGVNDNAVNTGTVISRSGGTGVMDPAAGVISSKGRVLNSDSGIIKASAERNLGDKQGALADPLLERQNSVVALGGGSANLNQGLIELNGPAVGMLNNAETNDPDGYLNNAGTITLNGYINGVNLRDIDGFAADSDKVRLGAGIVGRNNTLKSVNTGSIAVTNSGTGMLAMDGAEVTNQGTITLDVAPGVTDSHDQLYGMVAIQGGTVINGENGKIIITAAANALTADGSGPIARPFYRDGNANSKIVNLGQICIGDAACQDADEWNPGSDVPLTDAVKDGDVLAAQGETRDAENGFYVFKGASLSNAGTVTGGALGLTNNVLTNDASGVINSAITSGGQESVLNNHGVLAGAVSLGGFADTLNNDAEGKVTGNIRVTKWGNLNNSGHISGGITTLSDHSQMQNTGTVNGRIDVQSGSALFNQGNINVPSGSDMWVDAGTLLVNQQGGTLQTGNKVHLGGTVINEKGGHVLVNGAGSLWLEKNNTSLLINRGEITGTGKINMIGQAGTGTTVWNTTDGVITLQNGSNGSYAANPWSTDSVFINDGEMNVSGKDAIAIYVGSNSRAVNNGTINLGVSGDGSSGLIAMKLDKNATAAAVIENNGTININAGNSFAFSKEGANGRIINNGQVVIAEGVTGAGIIKQPGLADSIEHDVHADFVRPALPDTTPHPNVIVNGGDAGNVATFNEAITAVFPGSTGGTVINGAQGDMVFAGGSSFNGGGFLNQGNITRVSGQNNTLFGLVGDDATVVNDGSIANGDSGAMIMDSDHARASFWNSEAGTLSYTATGSDNAALRLRGTAGQAINDGTMNLSGTGAVGMHVGSADGKAINNGTISLGTAGTADTGMVAMRLGSDAGKEAVLENNGTISIFANDSFAFSREGANGRIINNGNVVIADGVTGSGIIKQPDLASVIESGVHTDYTRPSRPDGTVAKNVIEGYTIGTTASGYAGRLQASNAVLKDVTVDTGFTAGSAARTVTFNDVVTGKNIEGAENIRSESVVWSAKSGLNDRGNVDVTLTKNSYADVAQDKGVASVADALDRAYTSNSLFTSLNLKSAHELSRALRQISGSQATSAFNDARILTSRFDRLSEEAPDMGNGLAFNVISRNDKRAEMGNNVRYDMFALKQSFALNDHQSVGLEYGMARLNGNGTRQAGDNGLTGGYSQFMGLKHTLNLGDDYSLMNSLRYDRHELKSSRSISYGNTSRVADASNSQQYMELRTEGSKHITLAEGLNLTPSLGLKMRHTVNGALHERGAGDFNLALSSSTETAVDSVVGLKLDYAGKDGWSASASLEGGPNLSFSKSQRTGSLQGAKGVNFNLDDGQKGGGLNGVAELGVNYSKDNRALSVNAFQWQEDGIKDKGFMMNYNVRF
ncbi:autotransporter outer membrane beta-barrel domain-containing protein [Enterobacter sp. NFIX58]|uniref:autotransporter outer membrane beta-barrel domain-containing protein n=1 Tax=Enterobacter sp. NFIX58 TaxID=1566251 RepID=UPI0011138B0B|nr:autotransporter outer membrane beta-barrel domain-containing protein [Enterobacter sp. NFIX58]